MVNTNMFIPWINGFPFANSFPNEPCMTVTLPVLGKIKIGNNCGLCGGMTFAAMDYYLANEQIPGEADEEILEYIRERMVESLGVPWFLLKIYQATQAKRIRTNLEGIAFPAPVTLILVHSVNPFDMSQNHQVILTGLQNHRYSVYDPNYPGEEVYIQAANDGGGFVHSHGFSIRGILKNNYTFSKPD